MDIFDTVKSRTLKSEYRKIPNMGLARVNLRFDDNCGNGYNSFGITMESKAQNAGSFGGCMHDEIAELFPEYRHLIGWHLMSSDGPMHYVANTVYHMENGDLNFARSTAIAPFASKDNLVDKEWLLARLPQLISRFKIAMIETFKEN